MINFLSTNWEAIIASLALLTSLVTTIILYRTFKLHEIHNVKSVKPIIHIGQWDYENRIYVTLVNQGAGLAWIKKIEVYNEKGESKNCIYDWLPNKLPEGMNYKEYWIGYKDFVIQAGQEIRLVEIPVDTSDTKQVETREKIRSILRQLTIKVSYKDLYDNQMDIKEMKLFWFSRTDNVN